MIKVVSQSKSVLLSISFIFLVPLAVHAGPFVGPQGPGIEGALEIIFSLLNTLIQLLIAVATVVFIWGVIKYVSAGGDEDKLKEGRNLIIFGIIALAVIVTVWGLVALLTDTFGVGGVGLPGDLGDI